MSVPLIRTPEDVCVHCQQSIIFQGIWIHLSSLLSACDNGRTNAQPSNGSRWTPPADQAEGGAQRTRKLADVPVEVAMTDGSRWVVYYRVEGGFPGAVEWVIADVGKQRVKPAEDLDGVQRGLSHINMAHVVSFRQPEGSTR